MKKMLSFALAAALSLMLAAPAFAMNECVFSTPGINNVISSSSNYVVYAAIDADSSLWLCKPGSLGGDTSYQPVSMKIMDDVASVSIGTYVAIVKTDGSLWMIGGPGDQGEDGPTKVMDDVVSVSCGRGHIAAVKTDGSLWTWGSNNWGQLGNGGKLLDSTDQDTPVKVMDDVVSVSCGAYHTAAVKTDGSLWIWGGNNSGQLGTGDYNAVHAIGENVPVKILDNVAAVCCGSIYTAAIKTDGSLWMWGSNLQGQLGIADSYVAVPTKVLDNVMAVSCSEVTTAALKTDGSVWISGVNSIEEWQTGQGVQQDSYEILSIPTKVADNIIAVFCLGDELTIAIKADGSVIGNKDVLSALPDNFVVMLPDSSNKTQTAQPKPTSPPTPTPTPGPTPEPASEPTPTPTPTPAPEPTPDTSETPVETEPTVATEPPVNEPPVETEPTAATESPVNKPPVETETSAATAPLAGSETPVTTVVIAILSAAVGAAVAVIVVLVLFMKKKK